MNNKDIPKKEEEKPMKKPEIKKEKEEKHLINDPKIMYRGHQSETVPHHGPLETNIQEDIHKNTKK